MIVEKIADYLAGKKVTDESVRYEVEKIAGAVFKRQFMTDDEPAPKGRIRLSSVGRCQRQTAYAFHGIEKSGKEIDARAKVVFWTGDLTELTVVNLAKLAGVNVVATGLQQLKIQLPVNGSMISGHPDGIVFEDKGVYLLEVKSMSSFSYKKFEDGVIDETYIAQVNAYMEALGLSRCIFIALNKDSGVLMERVIDKDPNVVNKIRETIKTILHSTPESLPEAPKEYGPDVKGFYAWQCLYCAYWKRCRPNAGLVLEKNRYKLKEGATDGDRLSNQTKGSGDGHGEMGAGIRPLQTDGAELGGHEKNNPVGRNAEKSGPPAMEIRGRRKNVKSIQESS
jgi:hypothetical protein